MDGYKEAGEWASTRSSFIKHSPQLLRENGLPDCVFIDVEASGLHATSFPLEIGWALGDLSSSSFLIRPHQTWSMDDWSHESAKVHGISAADCRRHGLQVETAARLLNAEWSGKVVLSDAPRYDSHWLLRLFDAAGVDPGFLPLHNSDSLALTIFNGSPMTDEDAEQVLEMVNDLFPVTHRADQDALHNAAQCLALEDSTLLAVLSNARRQRLTAPRPS